MMPTLPERYVEQATNATKNTEAIFDQLRSSLDVIKRMKLPEAAAEYVRIKELCEEYERIGKILSETVTLLKQTIIPEMFDRDQITSFNTREGYRVTVSMATRASMTDKILGSKWLKENGLGSIVTETVNASTLSATAKTMLEDGKELPPELFNVYLQPNTSVTKLKAKT